MERDEGFFGGSCLLLRPLDLFLVAHREYQGLGDGTQTSTWPGNFPGNVRDAFRMKCGDQEGFNCQRRPGTIPTKNEVYIFAKGCLLTPNSSLSKM